MRTDGPHSIAVVGGGVAGLVSAWELARSGAHVHLFERDQMLGGRVHSTELGGETFDVGAESFATRGGEAQRLIDDLGLSEHIQFPAQLRSWIISAQAAAPLPMAGAIGIPVSPWSAESRCVLGIAGALRCAIEPLLPRNIGGKSLTVAALVKARLGARVLTRLVSPVVRGVYSTNPAALSPSAVPGLERAWRTHGSLVAAARAQRASTQTAGGAVAGIAGGIGRLVAHLELELERYGVTVFRGTEVRRVTELQATAGTGTRTGVHVETVPVGGAQHSEAQLGDTQLYDAVIVTVPGIDGVEAGDSGSARRDAPSGTRPAEIEVVALLLDDARLNASPRGTGALMTEEAQRGRESIRAKALTHASAKWPWIAGRLPRNRHLIRLSYGEFSATSTRNLDACTIGLDDQQVLSLARTDASRIFGYEIAPDSIVGMARQRYTLPPRTVTRTVASPTPPDASPAHATHINVAGEWVSGTGLAAVIPSARHSAASCLSHLTTTTPQSAQNGEESR